MCGVTQGAMVVSQYCTQSAPLSDVNLGTLVIIRKPGITQAHRIIETTNGPHLLYNLSFGFSLINTERIIMNHI